MKKTYEAAQIEIVMFATQEVIVASSEDVFVPSFSRDDNETEVL